MGGSPIGTGGSGLPTNLTLAEVPFQDWARELYAYRQSRAGLDDPHARCQPAGGMRFFTVPNGMEFIDQPELQRIFIIDGENRDWRRIAMEPGRKHPPEDLLNPSYFGDSIGHWEGETLVVDVTGLQEDTWFDRAGNFHSDALRVVERYTPRSPDALNYEATITDPKVFSRPWKISMPLYRRLEKNAQVLEFKCVEFAEELMYGHLRKQPSR